MLLLLAASYLLDTLLSFSVSNRSLDVTRLVASYEITLSKLVRLLILFARPFYWAAFLS